MLIKIVLLVSFAGLRVLKAGVVENYLNILIACSPCISTRTPCWALILLKIFPTTINPFYRVLGDKIRCDHQVQLMKCLLFLENQQMYTWSVINIVSQIRASNHNIHNQSQQSTNHINFNKNDLQNTHSR